MQLSTSAEPVPVDVNQLPSGKLDVRLRGEPVDVDVVALRSQLSIRVDGHMVDLTCEGKPPDLGVLASGHRSYVRVVSERDRAAEAAGGRGGGRNEKSVKSPMPGRVIKVMVAAGDSVEVGQPMLVVEAMKMENEVRAKTAGVVDEVHVAVGQTVEGNAKLLTFR
ncbi:MAG: acetyl-CoA carboxylase biotin carboxyl carrier protein subunit [Polyangiaceae bacterium]